MAPLNSGFYLLTIKSVDTNNSCNKSLEESLGHNNLSIGYFSFIHVFFSPFKSNIFSNIMKECTSPREQHALKKFEQLFEYQHLLLLRHIWWSKL
jgi:hypothetical protein